MLIISKGRVGGVNFTYDITFISTTLQHCQPSSILYTASIWLGGSDQKLPLVIYMWRSYHPLIWGHLEDTLFKVAADMWVWCTLSRPERLLSVFILHLNLEAAGPKLVFSWETNRHHCSNVAQKSPVPSGRSSLCPRLVPGLSILYLRSHDTNPL